MTFSAAGFSSRFFTASPLSPLFLYLKLLGSGTRGRNYHCPTTGQQGGGGGLKDVERELQSLSLSDSDYTTDEELRRRRRRKVRIWQPSVVQFPSLAAKEEASFFHELLSLPWQRGRGSRLLARTQRQCFPKHTLDSLLKRGHRKRTRLPSEEGDGKNPQTNLLSRSSSRGLEGFDYAKMGRALRHGLESNMAFRSQPSRGNVNCESGGREEVIEVVANSDPELRPPCRESNKETKYEMPIRTIRIPKDIEHLGPKLKIRFKGTDEPTPKELVMPEMDKPYFFTRHTELPTKWAAPNGTVVLIDKPKGWTSFTVCGKLRSLLGVKKVGHAGTLDPMSTGLLIVCVGNATKAADRFQAMSKVYTGTMRLGEATSSGDTETPVNMKKAWQHITDENIDKARASFIGEILQIPPTHSAIKIHGEHFYEKAWRGEKIDIPARKVNMHSFEVLRSTENRQYLHFKVECSKGTYVRSLCVDFGKSLDSCTVMTSLRRERNGDLSVSDAWDYEELEGKLKAAKSSLSFQ